MAIDRCGRQVLGGFTLVLIVLNLIIYSSSSLREILEVLSSTDNKSWYERNEGIHNNNSTSRDFHTNATTFRYGDGIIEVAGLTSPNTSLPPVSFGGCCGIGHRLVRDVPTMVYAARQNRPIHAHWVDIPWHVLFHDTDYVKSGPRTADFHGNGFPKDWHGGLAPDKVPAGTGTSYDRYGGPMHQMFEMPLAQALVKSMRDSLTPLVLSFLSPLRSLYSKSGLHICAHVRQGNNETGDWAGKKWRHISLAPVLNGTLAAMKDFVQTRDRELPEVSLFVASDNPTVRPWFEENVPHGWRVIKPEKEIPKPESGVWFGEWGSKTSAALTQSQKNEAMAEAVSDIFALGECDALYIPNYSSFTFLSIMLMRMERLPVFFRENTGTRYREVHESKNKTRPHITQGSNNLKYNQNATFAI